MNACGHRRGFVGAVLLLLCCGCSGSDPPAQDTTPAERAALAPTGAVPTITQNQPLPRSVAGITLGMSAADVEAALGKLVCHANRAGFQVCNGTNQPSEQVRNLQVYIVHDGIVSVSYETAVPGNVWDMLNPLIERYGRPSLSGLRERDTNGRVHEIYGWKDDVSLYSVRFMWRDAEGAAPELIGTVIALWDRKGYQQWEAETKQHSQATPNPGEARGPI